MTDQRDIVHIDDWKPLAAELIRAFPGITVFLFSGQLGAGKTTLIREICEHLGVEDPVSSPTFSIVNEYICNNGAIYHFDLYRIKSPGELLDIGWYEYIDGGRLCLVEWPEMAGSLVDDISHIMIRIATEGDTRTVSIEKHIL